MVKIAKYIQNTSKSICLYKYIGKYSEVNDVIKYTLKTQRLLIVLTAGALLIISRGASGCCVT